jgi:hypothetical protein
MKETAFFLIILLSLSYVTGCASPASPADSLIQHADNFYNLNDNDYPLLHLPLIKPIEAKHFDGSSPWRVLLFDGPSVLVPGRQDNFYYGYAIEELEKFAVRDGVIMAYSAYVDKAADAYIQDNYYHWFVVIPEKKISEGFHTEDEFRQYIQMLSIQDPEWQTPDDAYKQLRKTGCLEWFPDCN